MNNEIWSLIRAGFGTKEWDEQLERYVREHVKDSSWRDLTIMIDRFSIDFIREFQDKFLWWNWPSPEHIKKNERYKEFWWKYN